MKSKKVRIIIIIATAILLAAGITTAVIIGINKGREAVGKLLKENKPVISVNFETEEESETQKETEESTEKETQTEDAEPETEVVTDETLETETVVTENEAMTEIQTEPVTTVPQSQKPPLERLLEIDKGSYATGSYKDANGTIIYNNRSKDDQVMQEKNKWIKENFGTSFTYSDIEFRWCEEQQTYYWIYKYGNIHFMTSTSTSMIGYYYRNFYSFRIADYLGFYGTDFALYKNQEALEDEIFIPEISYRDAKMTVEDPCGNNVEYLKQLGWTDVVKEDNVTKMWSYESPEGVPAYVWEDGYIAIYVKYPEAEKEELCYFTIEEYNELINNKTWTVCSRNGSRGFEGEPQEEWEKYIKRYLKID